MQENLQEIKASEFFKKLDDSSIQEAYQHIRTNNIILKPSINYSVLVNNEPFPPKDFIRIIAELKGYLIDESTFFGGKANKPFEKLGYTIENKNMSTNTVINKSLFSTYWTKYKTYFRSPDSEQSEKYKWSVLKQVYDNWNWDNTDKVEMFKNTFEISGPKNLWVSGNFYPIAHTSWMFDNFKEETISEFNNLFNEDLTLLDRVNSFINFYDRMLPELQKLVPDKKINYHSHGDLRALALYLTLQYPEKYFLFKYGMVKEFCLKMELPKIKKGKKENLDTYINISNQVLDFIKEDDNFIEEYRNFTNKESNYDDSNLHLLTQDFIYTVANHFEEENKFSFIVHFGNWLDKKTKTTLEKLMTQVKYFTDTLTEKGKIEKKLLDVLEKETIRIVLTEFKLSKVITDENSNFFEDFLNELIMEDKLNSTPLNQILYGPPGTGKTYKTKELAVNIILGEEKRTRKEILQLYKELKDKEQISFTTFHQSMSYEDFVEGIKPVMANEDDESLKYEIEKGIFKRISSKAKGISGSKKKDSSIDFAKSNYFKMSLGGKNKLEVHNWCIENNLVSLGWGDNEDYSGYKNIKSWTEFRDKFNEEFPYLVEGSKYHIQAMFSFQKMKIGDIVLVSLGNHVLDAVGVIDGDYNYDANNQFGYHHNRKVKWLSTNMNASPELFVDKGISQQSIYEFNKQDIKVQSFRDYFSTPDKPEVKLNHVLIIDEINRGNISSIFGELITLLEQDKRSGADEEIEVILPYSKEPFTVPSNLYIIGTMNTADRSVEALDTALRRRFSFTEIAPDSEVLKEANTQEGIVDDINLIRLLDTINSRIELLIDKDHKIGHSYFINVSSLDDLVQTFKDKVIPLLEEYFYGDFGKIGLVLGKAFIDVVKQGNKAKLMKFDHEDSDILSERKLYCFTDIKEWDVKSFQSIYDTSIVLNG